MSRLARNADAVGTTAQTGNGRLNLARAIADTSTDSVKPAGAAPVGSGGPFVGPYAVAGINGIVVGTRLPNPVIRGNSATYTVTVDATTSSRDTKITAVAGLPTGAAFSSDCILSNTSASTHNTLTITTNASTTPVGTSTLTLTVQMYTSNTGICSGTSGTGSGVDNSPRYEPCSGVQRPDDFKRHVLAGKWHV